MSCLVDINVLSELRRKAPDANVVAWFAKRPPVTLYLSLLTLGGIRKGVEGATDTARRQAMTDWLETDLPLFFTGRILNVSATRRTKLAPCVLPKSSPCTAPAFARSC